MYIHEQVSVEVKFELRAAAEVLFALPKLKSMYFCLYVEPLPALIK